MKKIIYILLFLIFLTSIYVLAQDYTVLNLDWLYSFFDNNNLQFSYYYLFPKLDIIGLGYEKSVFSEFYHPFPNIYFEDKLVISFIFIETKDIFISYKLNINNQLAYYISVSLFKIY